MVRVLCKLPNASEEISGVKFSSHANGMLSEEISDEVAAGFMAITGYELVGSMGGAQAAEKAAAEAAEAARVEAEKAKAEEAEAAAKAKAEAEKAEADKAAAKEAVEAEKVALLARAAAIDFSVKANWGIDRLRAEVEGAEKAVDQVK